MKKILLRTAVLCLLAICLLPLRVFAEDYRTDIWRFNDFVGIVSPEEEQEIEDLAWSNLEELNFDFPICVLDDLDEDETIAEFADWFYDHNEFGAGEAGDGVLLTLDLGGGRYQVTSYGRGAEIFTGEALDYLCDRFMEAYSEDPCTGFLTYLEDAAELVRSYISSEYPDMESWLLSGSTERTETSDPAPEPTPDLPAWYPEDVDGWVNFHAAEKPCVVDDADMFTDGQEAILSAKVAELRQKHPDADFVIFTDMSTYGFSRGVYAADFFVFNGYGVGDNYSGMILFICMQPGNRGWWTAGTGDCEYLFSEENINRIDDRLEPYMIDGDYFNGVSNYLDDIDTMFRTGHAPQDPSHYIFTGLVSLGIGAVLSGIVLLILRGMTSGTKPSTNADTYLVPGSFKLTESQDLFNRKVVTKTVRESETRSGGGGGGSSYSGGYSSSSGSSFSGGGRSF